MPKPSRGVPRKAGAHWHPRSRVRLRKPAGIAPAVNRHLLHCPDALPGTAGRPSPARPRTAPPAPSAPAASQASQVPPACPAAGDPGPAASPSTRPRTDVPSHPTPAAGRSRPSRSPSRLRQWARWLDDTTNDSTAFSASSTSESDPAASTARPLSPTSGSTAAGRRRTSPPPQAASPPPLRTTTLDLGLPTLVLRAVETPRACHPPVRDRERAVAQRLVLRP